MRKSMCKAYALAALGSGASAAMAATARAFVLHTARGADHATVRGLRGGAAQKRCSPQSPTGWLPGTAGASASSGSTPQCRSLCCIFVAAAVSVAVARRCTQKGGQKRDKHACGDGVVGGGVAWSPRLMPLSTVNCGQADNFQARLQPIDLPELTAEDREEIAAGEQVRKQERNGKTGWGFVVGDVDAPPPIVMKVLSAFEDYASFIPVVRKADVVSRSVTAEGFETASCNYRVSRFWLPMSALQTVEHENGLVRFELDHSATGCVLQEATGFWHVAPSPNGSGSRVWFCVGLHACEWLPTWLVDYAAARALRRATGWLKSHVERVWKDRKIPAKAVPRRKFPAKLVPHTPWRLAMFCAA